MGRFLWVLRQAVSAIGLPGVVGVALLVCSAAFYVTGIMPLRQQLEAGIEQPAVISKRPANVPAEVELADFYRFFPESGSLSTTLGTIHHHAQSQGLQLRKGEYRLDTDSDGKMLRYYIMLPLQGSYFQVHQFIASALTEIPHLSLDDVRFERQRIGDASVDAQIKMTLYLRP